MFDQQRHGQYFYEKKIPSVEALVVFVVDRVEDLAAYGHLPAYADVEATLPSAEIKIRYNTDNVRPDQAMVAQVIRVEAAGIDLSLEHVCAAEVEETLAIHTRDAKIDHILRSAVAEGGADTVEELYGTFVWSTGHAAAMERFQAARIGITEAIVGLPVGLYEAICAHLLDPI
jgi:translation initiation factor 2 alpha subunit (eIF-2alpha)